MATATDPRRRMVRRQIAGRGIADRDVLAAMEKVPREAFLAEAMQEFAYEDTPLPIEEGQTTEVGPLDRVLEIGAGSGYAAAVLGELAGRVFTIERHPALADLARARLRQLGYENVEVRTGDGTLGWPEQAPFDAIIATEEDIEEVRFVPLIGEQGWSEEHETFREKPRRESRGWNASLASSTARRPSCIATMPRSNCPASFDAYVWFDRTAAVTPLPTAQRPGIAETYPFGL